MQPGARQETPKDGDDFQLYPCFKGLSSGGLDDHALEVEALVAGSKDEEKLVGPRLVRQHGGVPGAPDLAKHEGYKLFLLFL